MAFENQPGIRCFIPLEADTGWCEAQESMVDYCTMPRFINVFSLGTEIPFWEWLESPGVLCDSQHVQATNNVWFHESFLANFQRRIAATILTGILPDSVLCDVEIVMRFNTFVGPPIEGCQNFRDQYPDLKKSELPAQIAFFGPCPPSSVEEIVGPIGWQFWHSECGVPDPGPIAPT